MNLIIQTSEALERFIAGVCTVGVIGWIFRRIWSVSRSTAQLLEDIAETIWRRLSG